MTARPADSRDPALFRRLLSANLVTCGAAVLLHAVNCSVALLNWAPGDLHWPLLVLFALCFAVAIVLTGLSLAAAFRLRPADADQGPGRTIQLKLLAIAVSVLPLAVLAGLVLAMSAVTKHLDAQ